MLFTSAVVSGVLTLTLSVKNMLSKKQNKKTIILKAKQFATKTRDIVSAVVPGRADYTALKRSEQHEILCVLGEDWLLF